MFAGVSTHFVEYHPKAVAGLQRAAELAAVREAECGALVAVLDEAQQRLERLELVQQRQTSLE